jgi:hypothetical protein
MTEKKDEQKPINFYSKDFIGIFEEVLDEKNCQKIINALEKVLASKPSEIRSGKEQFENQDVGRKDFQVFANSLENEICNIINSTLDECIKHYADEFFILKNIGQIKSNEIKVQKTPPRGGYHVWHCEHSPRSPRRVLVWTLYLNDIPDGEGETEFLWQGVRVKPKKGSMCIFPAAFTHMHRGNPVYSCDKYIATGWYSFNE